MPSRRSWPFDILYVSNRTAEMGALSPLVLPSGHRPSQTPACSLSTWTVRSPGHLQSNGSLFIYRLGSVSRKPRVVFLLHRLIASTSLIGRMKGAHEDPLVLLSGQCFSQTHESSSLSSTVRSPSCLQLDGWEAHSKLIWFCKWGVFLANPWIVFSPSQRWRRMCGTVERMAKYLHAWDFWTKRISGSRRIRFRRQDILKSSRSERRSLYNSNDPKKTKTKAKKNNKSL
jgi:hypothetical protein